MRGNLLELADLETGHALREPERCYRQAIKLDPFLAEAYEDLAWFLDAVLGKRRKAKSCSVRTHYRPNHNFGASDNRAF